MDSAQLLDDAFGQEMVARGIWSDTTLRDMRAAQRAAASEGRVPPNLPSLAMASGQVDEVLIGGLLQMLEQDKSKLRAEALDDFGKYRIVRRIGQGGMGLIYLAEDTLLGRQVALKVLKRAEVREKDLVRFHREGAIAARLDHPGIIAIHEVGMTGRTEGGEPMHFLAMDFVDGPDLAAAMPELDLSQRIDVLEQVATAVGYAHAHGVVHRDLKPGNVLLGEDGRAIVTDFGLARSLKVDEERVTQSGAMIGTPHYMSPEQVLGDHAQLGPPSDVWALGVILFEMLADQLPFDAPALPQVYNRICGDVPRFPSAAFDQVPADLRTICLRALEREIGDRYPDAGELADDLRRWRQGEEITARPPTPIQRLGRVARRNGESLCRLLLAAAVALCAGAYALDAATRSSASESLHRELQSQVVTRLEGKLRPFEKVLDQALTLIERKPELLDRARFRGERIDGDELIDECADLLTRWKRLAWVSVSTHEGDLIGCYRVPGREPAIWQHKGWQVGEKYEEVDFRRDDVGRPWVREDNPPFGSTPEYDPRTRPFYRAAVEAGGNLVWTDPYVFWGSYPGITCCRAVFGEGGVARGVVTADIEVWQLSEVLERLRIGPRGRVSQATAIITTPAGQLLGHSDRRLVANAADLKRGEGNEAEILKLSELDSPIARSLLGAATVQALDRSGRIIAFQHLGRTYHATARDLTLLGLKMVAITIVPEAEVLGERRYGVAITSVRWGSAGLVVVLALACLGFASARRRRQDSQASQG